MDFTLAALSTGLQLKAHVGKESILYAVFFTYKSLRNEGVQDIHEGLNLASDGASESRAWEAPVFGL